MTETLAAVADLTPMAAIVIIAGIAATAVTQLAKRASWSKGKTERVALGISAVLGVLSYIVSGIAVGIPSRWVEVVGSVVVVIAGVALMSRAAYALLGHAIPDGTTSTTGTADTPESGALSADEWQQVQNVTGDHTHRAGDDG